jgi:hypothetical protein
VTGPELTEAIIDDAMARAWKAICHAAGALSHRLHRRGTHASAEKSEAT